MWRPHPVVGFCLAISLACAGSEYEDIGEGTAEDTGSEGTTSDGTTSDGTSGTDGSTSGESGTEETDDTGETMGTDDTSEETTTDTTGGCDPYGDPGPDGTDCCEGEMGIGAMDIEGFWCASSCTIGGTGECPEPTTSMAQCAIDDGMGGGLCAVLCQDLAGSSDCPTGMTCQDTGQMIGICTWAG